MDCISRRLPFLLTAIALVTSGCVSSRIAQMGPLPNSEKLVTLMVTSDRSLVADQCREALAFGPILGCQTTRTTTLAEGRKVRIVKIVRWTDSLPSVMAFEIDVHELCHAVASAQSIPDPCHAGNHGVLQSRP